MKNFSEEFQAIQEWGWNTRTDNVTKLASGGYRLDGSKTKSRVVLNAQPILNREFVFELKGCPAIEPNFDKGVWFMFCDENGKETGAELDALEFLTQPNLRGHQGTITYRDSQYHADGSRNLGETRVFDQGKLDHYKVVAEFVPDPKDTMAVHVEVWGKLQYETAWTLLSGYTYFVSTASHANIKVGSFLIGDKFAFKRVADRGPLFIDFTRYEAKTV